MLRIVYLSAPPYGREMLESVLVSEVLKYGHRIVYSSINDNPLPSEFPDYDIGINFLGTRKIPASEVVMKHWINFHPAPLPHFRGRNLCYHAIMNKSPFFGASVHLMDEGFDTGPVIQTRQFPITPDATAGDLYEKSVILLKQMFEDLIPPILESGKASASTILQDELQARYFLKIPLDEYIVFPEEDQRRVRALTVDGKYHAKVQIGGRVYNITPVPET